MSVEFEDNRILVKGTLDKTALAFLAEAGGEIQSAAARNSRVDTGQTKGSYESNVDNDAFEAAIGSGLENAIWEEFGTGEYALNDDGRKGGWVYRDSKGGFHYTRGKTPNRPLQRAFESLRSKIISMAEDKFKGVGE